MLTSRTLEGRMYMHPDRPEVASTIVGVVGRGQAVYELTIHGVAFLSNHFHMLVTGKNPEQVAGFMQYVKGNLTRRINKIRERSGTMWHRRYDLVRVGDDERAQVQMLAYVLAHGAKEGLVRRPEQWPGVSSAGQWLRGDVAQEGAWRPGRTERIALTPLPGMGLASIDAQRDAVAAAVDAVIAGADITEPEIDAADRLMEGDWRRTVKEKKKPRSNRRDDSPRRKPPAPDPYCEAYKAIAAWYAEASRRHAAGEACVFPPWTFPRWQRMGGRKGLRCTRMTAEVRAEWRRRMRNGVYRSGTDPPRE